MSSGLAGLISGVILALGGSAAMACSVSVPSKLYINLVRLEGPAVDGLEWVPIYNVLDYTGEQRVLVSVTRQGQRVPVAKWEGGQECVYDSSGAESCTPNQAYSGIRLEAYFDRWVEAADRRDALKKVFLPLIVEVGGREMRLLLHSRPVRATREMNSRRSGRIAGEACELLSK